MKKIYLKKWIILSLTIAFICVWETSALAWGDWIKTKFGGCFKKSEVMYDKCYKKLVKNMKKDLTEDEIYMSDQQCIQKSRNFLLKCRLVKGKLKEGVNITPEQLLNMLSILNNDGFECRRDLLMKCGKKHFPKKGKPNKEEKEEFTSCVNKEIIECDQDSQENKLLEKYISTKAEKSQKKKKK